MSEALKLRVETRDPAKNKGTGTRASQRLRKADRIPGVIYGHKQPVVPITLAKTDIRIMLGGASQLAELDLGDKTETVLIREIQWDHLGKEVLHVDFARVNREELIDAEVNIELRGEAEGVAEGGRLQQVVHALTVKCSAGNIPTEIKIDVTHLKLSEGVHVRDLTLPEGVVVAADPDILLVHIVAPPQAGGEETTEAEAVQPEVIKPERKDKED